MPTLVRIAFDDEEKEWGVNLQLLVDRGLQSTCGSKDKAGEYIGQEEEGNFDIGRCFYGEWKRQTQIGERPSSEIYVAVLVNIPPKNTWF